MLKNVCLNFMIFAYFLFLGFNALLWFTGEKNGEKTNPQKALKPYSTLEVKVTTFSLQEYFSS